MAVAPRPGAGGGDGGRGWLPGRRGTRRAAERRQLQRSVRCLINEERGKRDLGRLARDKDLQEVGLAHSEVMVETNCLAHQCAGEEDLETRLREAGYFDDAEMWQFAENTGCALSAGDGRQLDGDRSTGSTSSSAASTRSASARSRAGQGPLQRGYATFAVVLGWHDGGIPGH